MRKAIVNPRCIAVVVALIFSTSVMSAQQATTAPAADVARSQVEGFERSLRGAIDSAASQLAKRVREALPGQDIVLRYQDQPVVTGVMMPDVGPVFHVLIPAIEDLSLKIITMNARRPSQGQRVANDPNRVGATGLVVDPDPASPVLPSVLTNPDLEYTTLARECLIDAVLDSALSLPVPPTQHLIVIAGELPPQPLTPFYQRSRMLILQIKGEDLIALRENRIDRATAKGRIKETKFPN